MGTGTLRKPDRGQLRQAERSGVETAARVGYTARAVVYAVVGVLALMLALGQGGRTTGTKGAVRAVGEQPFGAVLLVILGVGLLAFAAWRFVEALKDLEHKGRSAKGVLARAGQAGSGLLYAALGVYAFRLVAGQGGGGGEGAKSATAQLMSKPFGQVLVAAVGVGVLVFAVQQLHEAWKGRVLKQLSLSGLAAQKRQTVERVCRFGVAARAVVFLLMGVFLLRAAVEANPGEARGLGEALGTLAQQPFGPWLLGVVALGLVAYALSQVLEARYRHFPTP